MELHDKTPLKVTFISLHILRNKKLKNSRNQDEYNKKNYYEIHNRIDRSNKGIKKTEEIDENYNFPVIALKALSDYQPRN